MRFVTNKVELQEKINIAQICHTSKKDSHAILNVIPVITINSFSCHSTIFYYDFHFETPGAVKIGDIQKLHCGFVRRIEHIIN